MEHSTQQISVDDVYLRRGETKYSKQFVGGRDAGFYAGRFKSTGGNVVITLQASDVGGDNSADWFDPVDSDNAALGKVYSFTGAGEKYVEFIAVLAPYLRFKIVEGNSAPSTVTFKPVMKI